MTFEDGSKVVLDGKEVSGPFVLHEGRDHKDGGYEWNLTSKESSGVSKYWFQEHLFLAYREE